MSKFRKSDGYKAFQVKICYSVELTGSSSVAKVICSTNALSSITTGRGLLSAPVAWKRSQISLERDKTFCRTASSFV